MGDVISSAEAAKFLGLKRSTFYMKYVRSKKLVPVNEVNPNLTRPKVLFFRFDDVKQVDKRPLFQSQAS